MPATNFKNSFWIGVVILFALVITAGSFLIRTETDTSSIEVVKNRAIYNAKPTGYKAWHMALERSGLAVSIWKKPFKELGKKPTRQSHSNDAVLPKTMVIIEPYTVSHTNVLFGKEQVKSLLNWIFTGNRLVLIDSFDHSGTRMLLRLLGVVVHPADPNKSNFAPKEAPTHLQLNMELNQHLTVFPDSTRPALMAHLTEPILSSVDGYFELQNLEFPVTTLATVNSRPVMIDITLGQGHIVLSTLTDLASNQLLFSSRDANYQFLTNVVTAPLYPVIINEYVHGYTEVNNLLSYYAKKTPLGKVFLQGLLFFIALLWLSFYRWYPSQARTQKTNALSQKEYTQSLAHLYEKNRAQQLVMRPYITQIANILQQRYQLRLHDAFKSTTTPIDDDITPSADISLLNNEDYQRLALIVGKLNLASSSSVIDDLSDTYQRVEAAIETQRHTNSDGEISPANHHASKPRPTSLNNKKPLNDKEFVERIQTLYDLDNVLRSGAISHD